MDRYKVIPADDNLFMIEEDMVRSFLLVGSKKALLIDTGCMLSDIKSIIESITDLPVILANTHADRDHISCNHQFEAIYIHPSEYASYHNNVKRNDHLIPLWEGDSFDLGDRKVIALFNPGHSQGCMTFFDEKGRRLIGGDSIQSGRVFMFGPHRDLLAYLHTMRRMESYMDRIDVIFPSHAECPVKADIIPKLADGVEAIIDGKISEYREEELMGIPIRVYDIGVAQILFDGHRGFFEE
ncbi:MAG: MBL fold metallo-hydrolase [Eubacterium sp.]|nr:MBL fold metallo-hydrolase [Eubacterium sp.]